MVFLDEAHSNDISLFFISLVCTNFKMFTRLFALMFVDLEHKLTNSLS